MDHLKEQLKKHYEKTQPTEGFLQNLRTLEAPESAPVPVRLSHKRLLTPIASMLIAAVAILSGGKYLMDAAPLTAVPPEIAVESAVGFDDICYGAADAPTSVPEYSAAPDVPEMFYAEDPAPEETAPESGSADVTAPQPPTSPEPTDPVPPEDTPDSKPPIEIEGSADDPTPPPDDEPPYDPGNDDPPTDPGVNDPVDPPDDPVNPPDDPVDPPDDPVDPPDDPVDPPDDSGDPPKLTGEPSAKPPQLPEITARYVKENGQHMVYLTNCNTGRTHTINLTSYVTANGYFGIHSAFGWQFLISLTNADYSFSTESVGPGTSQEADISKIVFKFKMSVIGPAS